MDCSLCGGPLEILGSLGSAEWYRCRNCGSLTTGCEDDRLDAYKVEREEGEK